MQQRKKNMTFKILNILIPSAEKFELPFAAGRKVCGDYTDLPYICRHDVSDTGSVLVWYRAHKTGKQY
jgi:hypothetical protein